MTNNWKVVFNRLKRRIWSFRYLKPLLADSCTHIAVISIARNIIYMNINPEWHALLLVHHCTILLYLRSHSPLPSYKFQQSYLHFLGTKNSKSWRFLIIHKLCCMLQIIFFRIRYYSYSIQYPLSRQQISNDKKYTATQYHMEFRLQGIFQL